MNSSGHQIAHRKMFEAMAEVFLSARCSVERMEALSLKKVSETSEAVEKILPLRRDQLGKLESMTDLFEGLASNGTSWSQWLNETISKAVSPTSGIDENPVDALRSSENRFLLALDDALAHVERDPARGVLENMKNETLETHSKVNLFN